MYSRAKKKLHPAFLIDLQEKIKKNETTDPQLKYHVDNEEFLKNILKELRMIMEIDR